MLILSSGSLFVLFRLLRDVVLVLDRVFAGVESVVFFALGRFGVGPLLDSDEMFEANERAASANCVSASSPEYGVGGDGSSWLSAS